MVTAQRVAAIGANLLMVEHPGFVTRTGWGT
jgi:hypothetical protein